MEEPTTSEKRGRKRKDRSRSTDESVDSKSRKGKDLVGRYVWKDFPGMGFFLGKVICYYQRLYRVNYEDGDCEDLEYREIRDILVSEPVDPDSQIPFRKQKLEQILASSATEQAAESAGDSSVISRISSEAIERPDFDEADSSSDSCEYDRPHDTAEQITLQPLPLPPSSGNVGVPEDSVSFLFSVYTFLRSFSQQLFLSPFTIDNFVGCLNCANQNSLLDAIHVSVMRALRRHLDMLSADGSELAAKCLRHLDWNFLDTLTWPMFLLEYFFVMGYIRGEFWNEFCNHVLSSDYYTLPVSMKLRVLQILCDDVLDSAELRAEIAMRGGSEAEPEVADQTLFLSPESRRKRGRPRKFKTMVSAVMEASKSIVCSKPDDAVKDAHVVHNNIDGNSDECRLCGMDGTLICCDGCPCAYHSRCIGLSKAYLPDGVWFCPECVVSKLEPCYLRMGNRLRGAEVFGVDAFGQMFLGTCSFLLVQSLSLEATYGCKYYSQDQCQGILKILSSSEPHLLLYADICKQISRYWGIPMEEKLHHSDGNEVAINASEHDKDVKNAFPTNGTVACTLDHEAKSNFCSISESNVDNGGSIQENGYHEAGVSGPSTKSMCETDAQFMKGTLLGAQTTQPIHPVSILQYQEQLPTESSVFPGTIAFHPSSAVKNYHVSGDKTSILEFAGVEDAESAMPRLGKTEGCMLMGASFRPYIYINQYILGDVAASAAANLAILTAENARIAEAYASSNTGKITSESVSLQVKAFSEASMPFLWPSAERKLAEVPRERCGWCLACKAPPSRKMGCLLNAAASNALKGAVKVLGTFKHVRTVDCPLSAIAAYVLHMEECLHGLTIGLLSNANYRTQWRKQVELASTCKMLKYLLLELEENIHSLALSGLWLKPVDDWSAERCAAQIGSSNPGVAQKRGVNMRRSKKQSVVPDCPIEPCLDWWRGGKLSKMLYMKGLLPSSVVRKVARQGGVKKIRGLSHIDGAPRRSRQIAWRAAVEFSKNSSQLALQVRCLDAHIRWNELVNLEQNFHEVRGIDAESSYAFRDAFVCDKKVVERKVRYGLVFNNHKCLPSNLMKNVLEVETAGNGHQKLWLPDTAVPLYLIKGYEEKDGQLCLPSPKTARTNLQELLVKMMENYVVENIFSYLLSRGDKPMMVPCVTCQKGVLLRSVGMCTNCKGYNHKKCLIPVIPDVKIDKVMLLCSTCCHNDSLSARKEQSQKEPQAKRHLKIKLSSHGAKAALPAPVVKVEPQEQTLAIQKSAQKNRSGAYELYGLIWKRNKPKSQDGGLSFRLHNILHRGRTDLDALSGPVCSLCQQPYNPALMYVRCMTCPNWFHADAVELKEDELDDLEGLRCGKCRRKASPICPFMTPEAKEKKLQRAKSKRQASADALRKADLSAISQRTEDISESPEVSEWCMPQFYHSTEDVLLPVPEDNIGSFMDSAGAEHATDWLGEWPMYDTPKKLPVRRQIKQELPEDQGFSGVDQGVVTAQRASIPMAEWDLPNGSNFIDSDGGRVENGSFEPQTFFSFTELMALGDADLTDSLMALGLLEDTSTAGAGGGDSTTGVSRNLSSFMQPQQKGTNIEKCWQGLVSVACQRCEQVDPVPDLVCSGCHLQIHSQCSPWVEDPCHDPSIWRCGNCRDWR